MAKDAINSILARGDYVVFHNVFNKTSSGLCPGHIYVVSVAYPHDNVIEISGRHHGGYIVKGKESSSDFVKIIGGMPNSNLNYEGIAEALIKLNNSKPRSPLKEEIVECLRHQISSEKSGAEKTE